MRREIGLPVFFSLLLVAASGIASENCLQENCINIDEGKCEVPPVSTLSKSEVGSSLSRSIEMETSTRNGFTIVTAEYWPYIGSFPFQYPDDVLWGFYHPDVEPKAVKCAEKSYAKLLHFIENPSKKLLDMKELGGSTSFVILTNDYLNASKSRETRIPRLWFWTAENEKIYQQGVCVWEGTLNQGAGCVTPSEKHIAKALDQAIACLKQQARTTWEIP